MEREAADKAAAVARELEAAVLVRVGYVSVRSAVKPFLMSEASPVWR